MELTYNIDKYNEEKIQYENENNKNVTLSFIDANLALEKWQGFYLFSKLLK